VTVVPPSIISSALTDAKTESAEKAIAAKRNCRELATDKNLFTPSPAFLTIDVNEDAETYLILG
jgi:hypothetical protein